MALIAAAEELATLATVFSDIVLRQLLLCEMCNLQLMTGVSAVCHFADRDPKCCSAYIIDSLSLLTGEVNNVHVAY